MFAYAVQMPLYLLSGLIKKDKNLWLFGAWAGENYSDNTRYVYEYVSKHDNCVKAYWVSKDKEVVKKLLSDGKRAYYYYSIRGYFIGIRASVVFITQTHQDVNFYACKGAAVINCWHGIPMKKILFDADDMYNSRDFGVRISYRYIPYGNVIKKNDFVICTGEMFYEITKSAFRITDDHIFINGYPRNDMFLGNEPEFLQKAHSEGKKVIIYLPTHRNYGMKQLKNPFDEVGSVNEFCENNNLLMLYKPHFHEMKNMSKALDENGYKGIQILDEYDFRHNINSYLPYCDMLITDYSGAYFDYLLTNKPVIFFPYDLDWYLKNTGMYFDYYSIAKGPICRSWEEVFNSILLFLSGCDEWAVERNELTNKVFKYRDTNSSKRAYEFAKHLTQRRTI
jgi:CDP-glycerol glycerophosphotransferase (TagB/SpsB family)